MLYSIQVCNFAAALPISRILQNYQSTKSILLASKKITKNYTFFNFFKSLNKHVDLR